MPDKAWKAFERRVSSFFGTERTPLSGGNGKQTRSDTLHPVLFVEAKQRGKVALINLWNATKVMADKEHKVPVVCVSEKGRPGFWLLVKAEDLQTVAREAALIPVAPDEG
jgi:hypothetical protein